MADPGDTNPPGGVNILFAKFSQKLHGIERIWTPEGGGGLDDSIIENKKFLIVRVYLYSRTIFHSIHYHSTFCDNE